MTNVVGPELALVVDVTSFTEKGFSAKTTFEGEEIAVEFDQEDEGVFLSGKMAKKLMARKGTELSLIVENESTSVAQARVAGVGKEIRVSNSKVYYAIGREGGVVVRIRRPS
jgi:ABC-type lipoprotein release transport system permease subunit